MAVDYNILRPDGPTNLYAGFATGQQAAAQNALAQQKLAQERDLMSMRRQEFQANLEASQAERRRKAQVEKTAMFRERVLRAPTPQAARELVRLQHSDPDLGPVMQQFGSLDQDLADIPDDPTGFENWRQREAMGAAEFIKKNAARQRRQNILSQLEEGQPPVEPAAPAAAAVAPAAAAAAPAAAEPTPYTTGPQGVMTYPAGYFGVTAKRGGPVEIRMQDPNAVAAQQAAVDAEIERQRGASTPADVMQRAASYATARGEMYPTDNDIAAARRELNIPARANALAPAPVAANAMLAAQPAATAAPAAAAPAAALAAAQRPATGRTPERIAREIDLLSQEDDPALKGKIARLMKEYEAALKPAAAKPDTVPASVRELQAYLQMTPDERTAFEKLQKIRTPNVTATATAAGSRLESAEQKGKGELNVKQYGEIASAARLAARTLPSIETQAKILDQGFATGFGTEVKKAGASVLAALGVKEAEKFATDAQTFFAATQGAVLQKQLEQKGVQTEGDNKRITQTGAQLGNTVNANRFIIDVAKAQLRRDIDQRNFYDDWWSSKKTYEGAEDAWFRGEGGKSLFDRPELKKYLEPTASSPATSSVRSQADAILQRK
jgi:hypothetical protein